MKPWESFWHTLGRATPEAQFVQGLIHLATAVMGDMLEPQGLYPKRYLVKGFPSDEQMAEMQPMLDPGVSVASRG